MYRHRQPLPPGASDREFLDTQFPPISPGVVLVHYHRDQILRLLKIADKSCETFGELYPGWDYYDPDDLTTVVEQARANLPLASVKTLTMQARLDHTPNNEPFLRFTGEGLCQYESWGHFAQSKIINALHMQAGDTVTVTFTKVNK